MISLEEEQVRWLKENHLKISELVRCLISDRMEVTQMKGNDYGKENAKDCVSGRP
jgi:hypothetical protein